MLRTMNQDEYRNMEGEYINQIRQISHRIARSGQNSLIQDDNAADAISRCSKNQKDRSRD